MPDPGRTLVALREQRERTIQALCEHFAQDHLEVEEFERRLDQANRATSLPDLRALTADLPVPAGAAAPSPPPAAQTAPVAAPARSLPQRASQLIVGIMGGATRRGRWTPAQETTALAVMGGVQLDFREAQLPPGETVVHAVAFMGGVEIFVPPGLEVSVDGVGIMGGFDHLALAAGSPDPAAPRLRIDGLALMGGVEVKVQVPGAPVSSHEGPDHFAREQLRARRRELREEARRLRDEWRGRR